MAPGTPAAAFDGLLHAVLAVLVLYHGTLLVLVRDRTHGLHAAFVAALLLSSLAWGGTVAPGSHLPPGSGGWARSGLVALDAAVALLAVLLARRMLATRRCAPRLDGLLRGLAVLAGAAIACAAPGTWVLGFELVGLVSLLGPPVLLLAGAVAWRAGVATAAPWLGAQAALIAGLGLEAAGGALGPWTACATEVGTLAMALGLSLAIVRAAARPETLAGTARAAS